MGDFVKQLKIKTGIVKRLLKEHAYYTKEVIREEKRLEKLESDSSEEEYEYKVKKAKELLQESRAMIGDAKRRLVTAVDELNAFIISANFEAELPELVEARTQIQAAAEVN